MSSEGSFDQLMARLRDGDDDAARQVFQRFAGRLIGLARSQLENRLRQKVDPEDVVNSALKSFFRRQAEDQFELESWDSLWGLLSQITLRKCWRQAEHFRRARRDVRREVSPLEDGAGRGCESLDREPTAEEVAMFNETLERMMQGLDEREQAILQLRLQGCTVPEISQEIGRTEFTVEGVLRRIKKRLHRLREEQDV